MNDPTTNDPTTNTSGGALCEPDEDDTPCVECVRVNCCEELAGCIDDLDCECFADCLLSGDPVDECESECQPDPSAIEDIKTCMSDNCNGVC